MLLALGAHVAGHRRDLVVHVDALLGALRWRRDAAHKSRGVELVIVRPVIAGATSDDLARLRAHDAEVVCPICIQVANKNRSRFCFRERLYFWS